MYTTWSMFLLHTAVLKQVVYYAFQYSIQHPKPTKCMPKGHSGNTVHPASLTYISRAFLGLYVSANFKCGVNLAFIFDDLFWQWSL